MYLTTFPANAHPQVAALFSRLLPGKRAGGGAGAGNAQPSRREQQHHPQRPQEAGSPRGGGAGAKDGQHERQQRQQRAATEVELKEGGEFEALDEEQPTPESLDLSRHLRRVYAGAGTAGAGVCCLRVPFADAAVAWLHRNVLHVQHPTCYCISLSATQSPLRTM